MIFTFISFIFLHFYNEFLFFFSIFHLCLLNQFHLIHFIQAVMLPRFFFVFTFFHSFHYFSSLFVDLTLLCCRLMYYIMYNLFYIYFISFQLVLGLNQCLVKSQLTEKKETHERSEKCRATLCRMITFYPTLL